jgi:hypothetical protein
MVAMSNASAGPRDIPDSAIVDKLQAMDPVWSDGEVGKLMSMLSQDGPDSRSKGEFALHLSCNMMGLANQLENLVAADSKRNPAFNARLLPVYRSYIEPLKDIPMLLFCDVCRTILEDSEFFYDCDHDPGDEERVQQLLPF